MPTSPLTKHSISPRLLFGVLIFLLLAETSLFIACYFDYLAMDYGWEGRMNRNALGFAIASQLVFIYLSSKIEELELKQRMLYGQLFFAASILLWVFLVTEKHYLLQ